MFPFSNSKILRFVDFEALDPKFQLALDFLHGGQVSMGIGQGSDGGVGSPHPPILDNPVKFILTLM